MQWHRYLFVIVSSVIYCEFLADFIVILSCSWPTLEKLTNPQDVEAGLNAMLIADTHLLGPIQGHWLDKLYREWHMSRAFRSALVIHKPDVVFFLGDLFDEGYMVGSDDFGEYVRRFYRHFQAPPTTLVISAVGNHDVGFHYRMHPYFVDRFEQEFNNTGVQMYTIKGNHFIVINSMALEDDGCEFCENAIMDLYNVTRKLNCLKNPEKCKDLKTLELHKHYSRPIVLQHFPTYHESSISCLEHDFPILEKYREKWEVLSKNATKLLGDLLQPRLAFAGHSHHFCRFKNQWGIDEYTVASFSWRNKINPSFLMVSINPSSHSVYKCNMLHQNTVYYTYQIATILCSALIAWDSFLWIRRYISKPKRGIKTQ